jgi:RNA polymerase sigma factor (TIGR02999 family)
MVTQLLGRLHNGDSSALSDVFPHLYLELRRIAGACLRNERPDHTMQPTALVNDLYLRLEELHSVQWSGTTHFLSVAARLMRRILIDHARNRRRAKRDGALERVQLDDLAICSEFDVELLALSDALDRLEKLDPRAAEGLVMQYFGGMTIDEIALALDVSTATVERDRQIAMAWMRKELRSSQERSEP